MTKQRSNIKLKYYSKVFQRLISLTIILLLSLSMPAYSAENESLEQSQVALQTILAQHKGDVVYLDVWASWCVPCRKSFPWMNKMQQKYHQQGFAVVSVNLDAEGLLAKEFLNSNQASFPVIYDPKGHIARYFSIKGMPSSMLIDREGKIRKNHSGFFSDKIKRYEAEITALLKQ